jgi:hypothetical protein
MKNLKPPLLAAGLFALSALWAGAAMAAGPYASATVEGALTPGVYGRIEIGNAPPPPLIYAQPVIIQRPAVIVQQPPMYLHVPPGHAKKWSKHCAKYNACGQPVYFVKVNGDDDYERGKHKHKQKHKHKGDDDHGRGEKHGKGRD